MENSLFWLVLSKPDLSFAYRVNISSASNVGSPASDAAQAADVVTGQETKLAVPWRFLHDKLQADAALLLCTDLATFGPVGHLRTELSVPQALGFVVGVEAPFAAQLQQIWLLGKCRQSTYANVLQDNDACSISLK